MARTKYCYYEFGEKISRLWPCRKEKSDRYIHLIQLNDGNYIKDQREINTLFKNFCGNELMMRIMNY